MRWWWVAMTMPSRPKGQRALGAFVTRVHLEGSAIQLAMMKSKWGDGCEYLAGSMPPEYGDPPVEYRDRILSKEEAEQLALEWGGQRIATQDEIADAMLDDDAEVGDPLFKGRR